MKVLIIGSRVPWPLRDGGAIATYNLLKGLSESGVEVSFLTLNTNKHFAEDNEIFEQLDFLEVIGYRNIDTSVKILPALLNLFSSRSYNIDRFISSGFREDIIEELNDKKYDLIQFEGLFVASYAEGLDTALPKVLRQHNIEYKIWESLAETCKPGLKKWYLKLLSRRLRKFEHQILKHFDAVVSITEDDGKEIEAMGYKGLNLTIPAGIEVKSIPTASPDYNTLYHVGSMEWMPNLQAMEWFRYSIWPIIEKAHKEATFYMAGKNMPASSFSWQNSRFNVAGEIPDLNLFSSDKSILVVPLQSGSGIRIKTIEAMMAGKAVVTTSFGARGIPLEHGKNCLMADSETDFANAVLSLLNDTGLRNRIAENGRQFALANYSNQSVSEKWKQFYQKLTKTA